MSWYFKINFRKKITNSIKDKQTNNYIHNKYTLNVLIFEFLKNTCIENEQQGPTV